MIFIGKKVRDFLLNIKRTLLNKQQGSRKYNAIKKLSPAFVPGPTHTTLGGFIS
jgi:hypothetical protein